MAPFVERTAYRKLKLCKILKGNHTLLALYEVILKAGVIEPVGVFPSYLRGYESRQLFVFGVIQGLCNNFKYWTVWDTRSSFTQIFMIRNPLTSCIISKTLCYE